MGFARRNIFRRRASAAGFPFIGISLVRSNEPPKSRAPAGRARIIARPFPARDRIRLTPIPLPLPLTPVPGPLVRAITSLTGQKEMSIALEAL
jgi:hypothetical protein